MNTTKHEWVLGAAVLPDRKDGRLQFRSWKKIVSEHWSSALRELSNLCDIIYSRFNFKASDSAKSCKCNVMALKWTVLQKHLSKIQYCYAELSM